ncbi:MAG TPA: PIN domain-containing protein [Thermoanaerobaculia bacterium]|nr:PIN domain-containing protein [Thermoanaerobaculia bacterium]
MIAIDTSSLRRWSRNENGADVERIDAAILSGLAALPPIVLSEALSSPAVEEGFVSFVLSLPLLPVDDGYWKRAGELRRSVLEIGRKAMLADALIAQVCIDNNAPLITHDADFRHFVRAGLKLA